MAIVFKHQILIRRLLPYTRLCGASFRSVASSFHERNRILRHYTEPKQFQFTRAVHLSTVNLKTVSFLLADIGEGIQEVVVKEWYVKEGDKVSQFDNICEVQSDKASVTITSRYDGIIQKIHYDVDDVAAVGQALVDIEVEKEEAEQTVGDEVQEREAIAVGTPDSSGPGGESSIELPKGGQKILTTPAVRRIAMEHQVDLSQVSPTGRDGRVLKEDVILFLETKKDQGVSRPSKRPDLSVIEIQPPPPASATMAPPFVVEDRVEKIRGYKKTMIKTMTASMKIPHFGYCDEINMTELMKLRSDLKSLAEERKLKLSFMPLFIKAASVALKDFPVINSSIDDKCEKIIYKGNHNIGVAMDSPSGLVVPNIKGVQNLNVFEIARELQRLQSCGRAGAFSTADVTGGTFTLSNIGSIGGTYAKPLILPPEVAIGAIGKMQWKVVSGGVGGGSEFRSCPVVNVSWSADHRIIDGAAMARFSNLWKGLLEKPSLFVAYLI